MDVKDFLLRSSGGTDRLGSSGKKIKFETYDP